MELEKENGIKLEGDLESLTKLMKSWNLLEFKWEELYIKGINERDAWVEGEVGGSFSN